MNSVKKILKILIPIIVLILLGILILVLKKTSKEEVETNKKYIASEIKYAVLYDLEYKNPIKINRGEEVIVYNFKEKKEVAYII